MIRHQQEPEHGPFRAHRNPNCCQYLFTSWRQNILFFSDLKTSKTHKTKPSCFLSTKKCKQLQNPWSFTENIVFIFRPPLLPVISCYKWISAFYLVLLECTHWDKEGLEQWLVICPFSHWVSSHSSRLYHCHILPMQLILHSGNGEEAIDNYESYKRTKGINI